MALIFPDDHQFIIHDHVLESYLGCKAEVKIPDYVRKIAHHAFFKNTYLKKIIMSDAVSEIGDYAFFGCVNLSSVCLSPDLKIIGSYAFSGCENLAHLEIPVHILRIGDYAFLGCLNLEIEEDDLSAHAPEISLGVGIFKNCASPKVGHHEEIDVLKKGYKKLSK